MHSEDEEFTHRRRKKGQKREKVSMDEFIRRKREAENIKVETDKPKTPEVQPPEQENRPLVSRNSLKSEIIPVAQELVPNRRADSRQTPRDETPPPPLPMKRKESRPEIRNVGNYGQINGDPAKSNYEHPAKQSYEQRRQSVYESRKPNDDDTNGYYDQRRQSYTVPRQNRDPVRQNSNNRMSVISDRESVVSDRKSVNSDRKSTLPEFENNWQEGKTLAESNEYMLVNEIGCDVTFLVGPNEDVVSAHSYVLMARSSQFYKLLSGQSNQLDKLVAIPDVNMDSFGNLLRYLYTDTFEFNVQESMALVPTADKYGGKTMKQKCFKNLLSEMSSENVCAILELAHEFEEQHIYEKCLHFIHVNAVDTLNAHGFRHLCRECVEQVVDSDDLYADELSVFNGLIAWSNSECGRRKLQPLDKNRREVLGKLLYCVRYCTMGVHDFTHKISQNEILSADEKIMLFQFFHGKLQTLPQHFNKHGRRQRTIRSDVIKKSNQVSFSKGSNKKSNPYESEIPLRPPSNSYRNKEYLRVLRYKGITGMWRNKGPDAITFRCSASIIVLGIQIFGPPNGTEFYEVSVIIYDESRIPIRTQNFTITTDTSKVYDLLLNDPILLPTWTPLTVLSQITGAPSIRGTEGVKFVNTEDVEFEFISSCKSSNGTDESTGQIPSILFCKP